MVRVMAKRVAAGGFLALLTLGSAWALQKPWREYPGQDNIELPPDAQVPGEWMFARLMLSLIHI